MAMTTTAAAAMAAERTDADTGGFGASEKKKESINEIQVTDDDNNNINHDVSSTLAQLQNNFFDQERQHEEGEEDVLPLTTTHDDLQCLSCSQPLICSTSSSSNNNTNNIQVSCDECHAFICHKCHWCHEYQANHEIRVCDRCNAFYCRNCDEMDQCEDCSEVVCSHCTTTTSSADNNYNNNNGALVSCKFCGCGLCQDCATTCGRCGIVLCYKDGKFAVQCETCQLSYCLICLASRWKKRTNITTDTSNENNNKIKKKKNFNNHQQLQEGCLRCGVRPSKRMEQLVHLRLKSIYKAFQQQKSNATTTANSQEMNQEQQQQRATTTRIKDTLIASQKACSTSFVSTSSSSSSSSASSCGALSVLNNDNDEQLQQQEQMKEKKKYNTIPNHNCTASANANATTSKDYTKEMKRGGGGSGDSWRNFLDYAAAASSSSSAAISGGGGRRRPRVGGSEDINNDVRYKHHEQQFEECAASSKSSNCKSFHRNDRNHEEEVEVVETDFNITNNSMLHERQQQQQEQSYNCDISYSSSFGCYSRAEEEAADAAAASLLRELEEEDEQKVILKKTGKGKKQQQHGKNKKKGKGSSSNHNKNVENKSVGSGEISIGNEQGKDVTSKCNGGSLETKELGSPTATTATAKEIVSIGKSSTSVPLKDTLLTKKASAAEVNHEGEQDEDESKEGLEDATPTTTAITPTTTTAKATMEDSLLSFIESRDITSIQSFLATIKGIPGYATLRKNAKKALKRLVLLLDEKEEEGYNVNTADFNDVDGSDDNGHDKAAAAAVNNSGSNKIEEGGSNKKKAIPICKGNSKNEEDHISVSSYNSSGSKRRNKPLILSIDEGAANTNKPIPTTTAPSTSKVPFLIKVIKYHTTAAKDTQYARHHAQQQSQSCSNNNSSTTNFGSTTTRTECIMQMSPLVVGWVIGRGGQRIRDIMEESSAKIWIDQESMGPTLPRIVYVSGGKKNVDVAVRIVQDLVARSPLGTAAANNNNSSNNNVNSGVSSNYKAVEEGTLVTTNSSSDVETAMGGVKDKNPFATATSATNRRLHSSNDTGNMKISEARSKPKPHFYYSNVSMEAEDAITNNGFLPLSLIETQRKPSSPSNAQSIITTQGAPYTEILQCEARFVPLLIGRRGWTVKHIQDVSKARVDIDQTVTPRKILISGDNPQCVSLAANMVKDVLKYPHAQLLHGDRSDMKSCGAENDSQLLEDVDENNHNESLVGSENLRNKDFCDAKRVEKCGTTTTSNHAGYSVAAIAPATKVREAVVGRSKGLSSNSPVVHLFDPSQVPDKVIIAPTRERIPTPVGYELSRDRNVPLSTAVDSLSIAGDNMEQGPTEMGQNIYQTFLNEGDVHHKRTNSLPQPISRPSTASSPVPIMSASPHLLPSPFTAAVEGKSDLARNRYHQQFEDAVDQTRVLSIDDILSGPSQLFGRHISANENYGSHDHLNTGQLCQSRIAAHPSGTSLLQNDVFPRPPFAGSDAATPISTISVRSNAADGYRDVAGENPGFDQATSMAAVERSRWNDIGIPRATVPIVQALNAGNNYADSKEPMSAFPHDGIRHESERLDIYGEGRAVHGGMENYDQLCHGFLNQAKSINQRGNYNAPIMGPRSQQVKLPSEQFYAHPNDSSIESRSTGGGVIPLGSRSKGSTKASLSTSESDDLPRGYNAGIRGTSGSGIWEATSSSSYLSATPNVGSSSPWSSIKERNTQFGNNSSYLDANNFIREGSRGGSELGGVGLGSMNFLSEGNQRESLFGNFNSSVHHISGDDGHCPFAAYGSQFDHRLSYPTEAASRPATLSEVEHGSSFQNFSGKRSLNSNGGCQSISAHQIGAAPSSPFHRVSNAKRADDVTVTRVPTDIPQNPFQLYNNHCAHTTANQGFLNGGSNDPVLKSGLWASNVSFK